LKCTKSDYDTAGHRSLLWMAFLLHLIREFETELLDLFSKGLTYGPVHSFIGQEAVAVAVGAALNRGDFVGSSHRAHGHFLAKALMYYSPPEFDPVSDEFTPNMQRVVTKTLAEILGQKDGWCGGRGGSMHLFDAPSGNLGSNGIVGAGIPLAAGTAWGEKLQGRDTVVVSIFGDGAINQGSFHEAANLSALWNIPVIFLVENNLYSIATTVEDSSAAADLVHRGVGYGMESLMVDGMDPLAMYTALHQAATRMRTSPAPLLVEAKTYRFFHHNGPLKGSAFGYREAKEEESWLALDPVTLFPKTLIKKGVATEHDLRELAKKAKHVVHAALETCVPKKNGHRHLPSNRWPDLASAESDLRCETAPKEKLDFVEREDFSRWSSMTCVEAIAAVTRRNLEKDPRMIVLGEDVANFGGGAYGATKGALEASPNRVFNTPISENGFTGLAAGAASAGLRPMVEIMYPDFCLVAADQLFNQLGKLRYMFNGNVSFPLIVRTRFSGCQRLRRPSRHEPGRIVRAIPRLADHGPVQSIRLHWIVQHSSSL
jgi:2-oxoisovalerate dehydrogenase E1 component